MDDDYGSGSLATLLHDLLTSEPFQPDGLTIKRIPYSEYLKTQHWQSKRREALTFWRHKCCLCSGTEYLNVHHNCYDRLWDERFTDLVVLCHDCHSKYHLPTPPAEVFSYAKF
jgi:hypothetical protein